MTLRERILAVYQGRVPDVVPYMLDLSHWFYHRQHLPWDLSKTYADPERELIDYHKKAGAGFYLPNLAALFSVEYPSNVRATTTKRMVDGAPEIIWRIETPLGSIERARLWHEQTYSWAISRLGIQTEQDMRVFGYAMSRRQFVPHWDCYHRWDDYVGDTGVVYLPFGYSAIGHFLHYWMGTEGLVYAMQDWPALVRDTVEAVNANTLELVDLVCQSPVEIVFMTDNFSSDVQPPAFFETWSRSFYAEALARLHRAGKFAAVHLDGKLHGGLRMFREVGFDGIDAVTPTPMGDLTPEQCRAEAGNDMILSGGVSPDLWLPQVPLEAFEAKVLQWLDTRKTSHRLIAAAGDQVPPGADEQRIAIMRDLVETHGRF